jgi:oxygen-independent coproporphyrinogen-3 oxidase
MCAGEIDIARTERRHLMDFRDYFAHSWPQLESLEKDGLVELSARAIRATPRFSRTV